MIVGFTVGFFVGGIGGVFCTALVVSWKKHDEHISSLKGGIINDASRNEKESTWPD